MRVFYLHVNKPDLGTGSRIPVTDARRGLEPRNSVRPGPQKKYEEDRAKSFPKFTKSGKNQDLERMKKI